MFRRATLAALWLVFLAKNLAAAGIPVSGRMLETSPQVRSQAEITLEPILSAYDDARLRLSGTLGPPPVDRTHPDAEGFFALTAPEIGLWKVVTRAPGRLTMELPLVPLIEAAELPDLELPSAFELEVKVVDAEGQPIAATIGAIAPANLYLEDSEEPVRPRVWRSSPRLTKADDDGVASLSVEYQETLRIEALAAGHPLTVAYAVGGEKPVRITLPLGVARTVRIIDSRQRTLAGAVAINDGAFLPLGLSDAEGRLPLVLAMQEPPPVRVSTNGGWRGAFEIARDTDTDLVQHLALTPPTDLRGQVLEVGRREPIGGALVWARPTEATVTDARGRYHLAIPRPEPASLQAAATGYLHGGVELGPDVTDSPTLLLHPAATLHGQVMDEDGNALSQVDVAVVFASRSGTVRPITNNPREQWLTRTTPQGAFKVASLVAEAPYLAFFEKTGFVRARLEIETLNRFEERSGLRVVLRRGRLGSGRVVDSADQPIEGAEAVLWPQASSQSIERHQTLPQRLAQSIPPVRTDEEGLFQIPDLGAGRYDLEVKAIGFLSARVRGLQVPEGAGELDLGTVVLITGAKLEGSVADPDGAPVPGARIEVYKVGAMVSPRPQDQTSSDIEGHFALTDLRPDQPVRLRVQAQGFGTVSLSTVRPPTDEPIEIVLLPSGSIAGRVVDPSGRPVEQAHLSARPEHPIATSASSASASSASATSDAEGRFRLPELEPRPQRIEVSARSYQSQILRSIEPSVDGEPRFEIVLEPGAAVEGRITWEDDRPVVEASVSVRPLGVPPFGLPDAPSRSDTEGRFRVDGVALGSALIAVHLAGRERLQRQVEIEPGTNTVDLRLERGFEVSGRVLDAEGNPATGAALWLQQSRYLARIYRRQPQAVSTSDGSFKVPDITVGAYRLTAEKEGFYPASSELFEVAGDVAGVELTLRRGAVLQGEILNLDFDQLAALAISVNGEAGARRGRIDFAGSYKVDNLSPGSWRIRAQVAGAGRAALIRTVEIPEGATEVRQDLDFRTGFTLSGVVVDNGEPLVEAHVAALSTRGIGETTTDFAGRFRIDHLEAGSYQLRVMSSTVAPLHVRRLEIVADHELQIELATGSLAGTVTDSTRGRPLAGAAVALERLDARAEPSPFNRPSFRRTHSDSRGRFRFESLRSGDWQLVASRPGYAPFETLATVTGASEIDVPMAPAAGVSFTVTTDAGPPSAVHAAIVDPAGRVVAGGAHPVVDGKVKVTTVPPGQWDLLLQTGESAVTRVAVTAPGDQGQVHLPLGGGLRFELRELVDVLAARLLVTGPDGQPLIIPRSLYYPPGERTLAMGKTVLWHLHPGVWSYTVLHPDGRAWRGSATVTPGSTTVVRQVPGD